MEKHKALMSCRLIALDKRTGIRPTGIGECLRRLLAKSNSDCTKGDLSEYFGIDQLAGWKRASKEQYTPLRIYLILRRRTELAFS